MAALFSSPKVQQAPTPTVIAQPTVNEAIVNRSADDLTRQRRGQAATITGAGSAGSTSGSVAAKTLLGQ
jgi:hypothetical protein